MNQVCSKRGMLPRTDNRTCSVYRARPVGFGFHRGVRQGSQRFYGPECQSDGQEPVRSRTPGEHERVRLLHHHQHSGGNLRDYASKSAGFKKFESPNNKLDASATLSVDATLTVGAATKPSKSRLRRPTSRPNPLPCSATSPGSRSTAWN